MLQRGAGLAAAVVLWPSATFAQEATLYPDAARQARIESQLVAIKDERETVSRQVDELDARLDAMDARILALEAELRGTDTIPATQQAAVETAPSLTVPSSPPAIAPTPERDVLGGRYEPGKGMVLARGDQGELNFSAFTYIRYLNQKGLEDTYTDSFGRTFALDRREDIQFQKVSLNFKGWLFDPNFRYLFYVWTSNTSQGLDAQVVVAGNLSYRFNDHLTVGAGVGALPATRTLHDTFPNWLKLDHRNIADDFFRGSYTTGIWAFGEITPGLEYKVMAGNNLSQFGIDASQLDAGLNTFSGALLWMPTTGEYGPARGFGDFEHHDRPATILGVNYTRSREDAESQPGVNDFENSQLRLSDGTRIFLPRAFDTDGRILRATYQMLALSAGVKYRGWSLDGEFYTRWIDNLSTSGFIPVEELFDQGFQLQGSAMLIPQTLQAYVAGSQIYGEYGDPYDVSLGLNWYPMRRREVRINGQALYLYRSPVGNTSSPFIVGGEGWVFTTDLMVNF